MIATAVVVVAVAGIGAAVVLTRDGADEPAAPRATGATKGSRAIPFSHAVKPIGVPKHLVVRDVEVDAPVLPVGTTKAGAQDVPKSLKDTGWWKDGQLPGQPGNAVIVGHTASKDDGVFDDLGDLEKGDEITVRGDKGTLGYRVTSEREVKVENFAAESDRIYRETGPSGLVLMTCGDWNGSRFETTVIVYAEAVGRT